MTTKGFFTKELLRWNKYDNNRQMPWKFEKDPYKIWISEIILQQTRVSQGLEYYRRFIASFPDVQSLSSAKDDIVFKHWEGLGYYSRCKNIIASAKYIAEKLNGNFPKTYDDILALKGIGTYTASAIASFAYNLPFAVVDGNVYRVLARYFGVDIPVDDTNGKKHFSVLAADLLDKKNPGTYNQAIMDFGATVCKPLPECNICPLNKKCIAFLQDKQLILPVKLKTIVKKSRWLFYILANYHDKFYVRKREAKDIWQNLYEFILIETPAAVTIQNLQKLTAFLSFFKINKFKIENSSTVYKQQLTHQTIYTVFIRVSISSPLPIKNYQLLPEKELKKLPFPKIINTYLKD